MNPMPEKIAVEVVSRVYLLDAYARNGEAPQPEQLCTARASAPRYRPKPYYHVRACFKY